MKEHNHSTENTQKNQKKKKKKKKEKEIHKLITKVAALVSTQRPFF
jgi:hypothetical protein